MTDARWLVLTWRLPASSSSTPRVATWRSLQRLGAVSLTPGAAIVPFSEHLQEQLDWIAEAIVERGGDVYVLPVIELPEADESEIRRRMRQESGRDYAQLREAAETLARRPRRVHKLEREIAALERGLSLAVERDHFDSRGRAGAERAIRLVRTRKDA